MIIKIITHLHNTKQVKSFFFLLWFELNKPIKQVSNIDHEQHITITKMHFSQNIKSILAFKAFFFACHFIGYTLLVPSWTHFSLQNCLNSSWHKFNKVLETFLRDVGPYWHESITQLLQIYQLHIHDVNLPFLHIPKVLYWIEIWWLWRTFE